MLQLSMGCTAKEAAKNLRISHRTVENYLANLKSTLDCNTQSQLIKLQRLDLRFIYHCRFAIAE
jgi:DNA-binding CsgD family transcriptional regulator